MSGWAIFGAIGLTTSGLLAIFFTAMCRRNEKQEPNNERADMTPEEIVASVHTAILEILAAPDSASMNLVDLMNKAGMACFTLGVRASNSMIQGALEVHKARISR